MPDPARELIRLAMERFGNLWPAEAKMLRAAAEGTVADVADQEGDEKLTRESAWGCWEQWGEHRKIRAEVLRWVLVDDEAAGLVHEHGVVIADALVEGKVDLYGTRALRIVNWQRCALPSGLLVADSHLQLLALDGSHVESIFGDRLRSEGGLLLRDGFVTSGEVRLPGARIGGNLDFVGSSLAIHPGDPNGGRVALFADGIHVAGGVFFRGGMKAKGEVRLLGAVIGADLDCCGCALESPRCIDGGHRVSLNADGIRVKGTLFLSQSYSPQLRTIMRGSVLMNGARVEGVLQMQGLECDCGVNLRQIKVERSFWIDDQTTTGGSLDLRDANVARVHDSKGAWTSNLRLKLDGFRYSSITHESDMSVDDRIEWIRRGMTSAKGGVVYSPQPYQQLASVLAGMGREQDAARVRVAQYCARHKHEKPRGVHPIRGWVLWLWRWVVYLVLEYGYNRVRPLFLMAILWFLSTAVCWYANSHGLMVPASDQVLTSERYVMSRELPPDYPALNPAMYAADSMLPIIDLHQERFWLPSPKEPLLRAWLWIHIVLGWILSTFLAVGMSGLLRDEDEEASVSNS